MQMDCWDPRHWQGTWTVSWTGDHGGSAQLVFGLCQTRGHGKTGRKTATLFVRRAAKQRRIDRRAQRRGRTLDGERLQNKKTCCSRHVGSSLFQFLGVTRHVPFMVWRDGPEWSDDSVVSCGGCVSRSATGIAVPCAFVCGCWTTGSKTGGWCECGHVLDTEGERHVPRSRTWKRRGRGQRGGLPPTVCESVPKDLRRKSESGHTCLRGHSSRQGSSGNSRRTP